MGSRAIKIVLAAGLTLIAIAVLLTLLRTPATVAYTNGVQPSDMLVAASTEADACQSGETLRAGTSAIRLQLLASTGPPVSVEVYSGGRAIARGGKESAWYGSTVTVPVRPLGRAFAHTTVCFQLRQLSGQVDAYGARTAPAVAARASGKPLPGRVRIVYLSKGHHSWLELAGAVMEHMGLGRAASGTWIVLPIAALLAAAIALGSWALVRERWLSARAGKGLRRVPMAAWACAAVAFLNAACWSLITPPFQAPDEPSHFAYVQELAETGTLPSTDLELFSPAQNIVLRDLQQGEVRYSPQNHTIFSALQQRQLQHDLALPLSRVSSNGGVAASEPPLYYALETIPYYAGLGGTLLDRLALMRLLSALLGGVTALFAFMFVRETLPGTPWAWIVGGLGVAFAPLLGLMTGAVNPDALLYAVSAALFYCFARGFRRGLTPRLAAGTGALIALGLVTKLNFFGLLPGAILGLVVLTLRARRASPRRAYRSLALALSTAASLPGAYVVLNLLLGRGTYGALSSGASSSGAKGSVLEELSYIWQFYLPRLPGMHVYFPGLSTTRQFWIDGFVGLYGWVDTVFPGWVYRVALIPVGLLTVLFVSGVLNNGGALRRRIAELSVYAAMTIGLAGLVGASDYLEYPAATGSFAQPRYLLPLVVLYAACLAVAARGAGRRWGPVLGAWIVVLFIAHDIFSQLLEISRFYG